MPKEFTRCVRRKGKVRRFSGPNKKYGLKRGQYVNICWDKDGAHRGHVHTVASKAIERAR